MTFAVFIYGLLLGSFFNVVGMRVPAQKSVVKPGSACPKCGRRLSPLELIPVLSYVIQGGKCRHCHSKISLFYPVVELSTALLFVYAYSRFGWTFEFLFACTLISLLVIIFMTDINYMLIPDKILLAFTAIFFIERLIEPLSPWWTSITGAATGFALLLLIAIVSKGGMGGGDIKLFAVIGFALGTKIVLLSFFLASLAGAVFGAFGLLTGTFKRGDHIPFGPFISIGTLAAYFFHHEIFLWYFSLF
ncbi:prepilin peptidase [Bacillus sp. VT-16-64]|nr:prepilin peptidase [Bacillus sp. VT-16-64]